MAGKYVKIDVSEFRKFIERMGRSGCGGKEFKKALVRFMDSLAVDFLAHVEDTLIRENTVDHRNLLASFKKNGEGGVFIVREGGLEIEVGTNVKYASYVNDGHWLNPKGVEMRWVPGHWTGPIDDPDARFIYEKGAKTGMLLKQHWIEGKHFFDDAVRLMYRIAPMYMEGKMQEWLDQYFSDLL